MSLGLVIPLLDEAELTASVAQGIASVLDHAQISHRLVLVNNGSQDETGAIIDQLATSLAVLPIHLDKNAGYGGGILAGLAALERDGLPEVVGWCWGDGQVRPDVLPPLYRAAINGAPLAKAVRTERLDGTWRKIVSTGYAATMRSIGCEVPDVNGCPKLLRREAYAALAPRSTDWFLDAEVVLGAQSRGWEIAQHPTVMHPRDAGKSKVGLAAIAEFGWNVLRWRATNRL